MAQGAPTSEQQRLSLQVWKEWGGAQLCRVLQADSHRKVTKGPENHHLIHWDVPFGKCEARDVPSGEREPEGCPGQNDCDENSASLVDRAEFRETTPSTVNSTSSSQLVTEDGGKKVANVTTSKPPEAGGDRLIPAMKTRWRDTVPLWGWSGYAGSLCYARNNGRHLTASRPLHRA